MASSPGHRVSPPLSSVLPPLSHCGRGVVVITTFIHLFDYRYITGGYMTELQK